MKNELHITNHFTFQNKIEKLICIVLLSPALSSYVGDDAFDMIMVSSRRLCFSILNQPPGFT